MKQEEYKDGLKVVHQRARGIAVELEKCNDGSYVVHIAFPGQTVQRRAPIAEVEVAK